MEIDNCIYYIYFFSDSSFEYSKGKFISPNSEYLLEQSEFPFEQSEFPLLQNSENLSSNSLLEINRLYTCHQCDRKYTLKGTLTRHQRYECYKEKQFSCAYCDKKFTRKTSLKLHINTIHSKIN